MGGAGERAGLLTVVSVAAGLAVGVVAGIISRFFHLIILFPIAEGMLVALVLNFGVRKLRLRAPLLAALVGALGGFAAWAGCFVTGYVSTRLEMRPDLTGRLAQDLGVAPEAVDPELVEALIDFGLASEGGKNPAVQPPSAGGGRAGHVAAFRGYVGLRAANTSIGRGGSKGSTIPPGAAYLLWLVELGLAAGVAGASARSTAQGAFCEACDQFYLGAKRFQLTTAGRRPEAQAALSAGDVAALEALAAEDAKDKTVLLVVTRCPCGESPCGVAAVQRVPGAKKGEVVDKVFWSGAFPLQALSFLGV